MFCRLARYDASPPESGLFAKGFIGGGAITGGQMYDEDWGLASTLASVPTGYEITQSDIVGSLAYLTGDIGYNLLRARDHKVGVFVGYNIYQATMNTMGCNQLAAPYAAAIDQQFNARDACGLCHHIQRRTVGLGDVVAGAQAAHARAACSRGHGSQLR